MIGFVVSFLATSQASAQFSKAVVMLKGTVRSEQSGKSAFGEG